MAKTAISNPNWLLRTTGLGAVAAALAMMALPSPALAQDRRGRGGQSVHAQSHSGSAARNWGGGRRDGGARSAPRGNANWGGRSTNAQPQRNWSRPSRPSASNGGADAANARAARMTEIQRRRESASQPRTSQQWSTRNRSYTDPDRNRSYRSGQRADNWRDRNDRNRWSSSRRDDNNRWRDNDRRWDNDSNRWRNSNRWSRNDHRWNRDWRRDNRYDWYGYRNHNRHVYRLGRYYAPYRNYGYRRVGVGFYLDSLFFGSRYWLNDPWQYRLPPADGPYRWIRYYDDALLVDTYTGEVIDVINNFFW